MLWSCFVVPVWSLYVKTLSCSKQHIVAPNLPGQHRVLTEALQLHQKSTILLTSLRPRDHRRTM